MDALLKVQPLTRGFFGRLFVRLPMIHFLRRRSTVGSAKKLKRYHPDTKARQTTLQPANRLFTPPRSHHNASLASLCSLNPDDPVRGRLQYVQNAHTT